MNLFKIIINKKMKKEKKRKKYRDEEYVELKTGNIEDNFSKDKQIKKYKTIIGILIGIIIILIICICIFLFKNDKRGRRRRISNFKSLNKNNNTTIKENQIEDEDENNEEDKNDKENENDKDKKDENTKNDEYIIDTIPPGPKRKIYVKYMDFWPAFQLEHFDVHRILCERYEVIQSEKPDYVIFGEFGGENYDIENRINCVKLFLTIENRGPNFDSTDYAIGIHYIENGDRYFRKPTETHQLSAIQTVYNVTQVKNIDIPSKKFCAWVVSNGGGTERNNFFDKLSQYKVVDSGGSFRNNVGGPVDDKLEFLSHYKFSICFENSKTQGYISEKLVDAFEAGTIPIYFGDDTILELLNNKSYIHVRDESEFDEKIELIKKIDNNDTLYQEMIREKIVLDDTRYAKELQKYKNWIWHIIEQDKEKAKRFPRQNEHKDENNNNREDNDKDKDGDEQNEDNDKDKDGDKHLEDNDHKENNDNN